MTNIKRIFAIGYALDCLVAGTPSSFAVEKYGFSICINSDEMDSNELTSMIIAIECILESHGFEQADGTMTTTEYYCEELDTTVSILTI